MTNPKRGNSKGNAQLHRYNSFAKLHASSKSVRARKIKRCLYRDGYFYRGGYLYKLYSRKTADIKKVKAEQKWRKCLSESFKKFQIQKSRLVSYLNIFCKFTGLKRVWKWTGISEKKGWDIFQLLITASTPFVIFIGTQYFNEQQREISRKNNEQQREIARKNNEQQRQSAKDNANQATLVKYFEEMAALLDDDLLNTTEVSDEKFIIAQAKTVIALLSLDPKRQHLVIQFLDAANLNNLAGKKRGILYKARMSKANLIEAELIGAKLISADLSSANLHSANLHSADLSSADLSSAYLISAGLNKANLSSADLSSAYLISADLSSTDFSNADLSSTDFSNADLRKADLSSSDFSNADFSNADLHSADLHSADLSNADLRSSDLRKADLSSSDLSSADLRSADLRKADLSSAYLSSANLSSADLRKADLSKADLSSSDLRKADLSSAILLNIDLRETNNLTQSQLEGMEPPLICNSPLPQNIKIDLNSDCDKIATSLHKRYPQEFPNLDKAKQYVQEQRQKQWD